MAFLESPRFEGCPTYGYVASPIFSTGVWRSRSGREVRNSYWSAPLHRIQLTIVDRDPVIDELAEYYYAMGGEWIGFRAKNWANYNSSRPGQDFTALDQPLVFVDEGSASYWQLTKRYTKGAYSRDMDIYKPLAGILIADNGVVKDPSDYDVDLTTGRVGLGFTPAGTLTWGGEFDLPVRFDGEFPIEIINRSVDSVSFGLMELRQPE